MQTTPPRQQRRLRFLAPASVAALVLCTLVSAGRLEAASVGVPCPLAAPELSSILGRAVQRVSLGDPDGDRTAQCSFAAVSRSSGMALPSPQVFLTFSPGGVSDLRELNAYYAKSRNKLVGRPQLESRPDLGPGAFTLSSSTSPVATAFFVAGKHGVVTLLVDLVDAGRRDDATADKILALVRARLR